MNCPNVIGHQWTESIATDCLSDSFRSSEARCVAGSISRGHIVRVPQK